MLSKPHNENILVGGIEAGGTKFNCVVGNSSGDIFSRHTFATTTPEETLAQATKFFTRSHSKVGPISALGIAHFGPVNINPASVSYGHVLLTPKPGWSNTDVVGYFSAAMQCPVALQSDVNGAAIGEFYLGGAVAVDNFVYITVGTGIGGGVFVNGQLLNQLRHPEIGHMLVAQDWQQDPFVGCCPFHDNCLEGLAAGPAIEHRWGSPAQNLATNHPAWELEAHYLAMLCVNLTYCYAPQKIIFGGGVMQQQQLIPAIRHKFSVLMNGYAPVSTPIDDYISLSILQHDAATKGALVLGQQCYNAGAAQYIARTATNCAAN